MKPTLENVLEKFGPTQINSFMKAYRPSEEAFEEGARAAVLGLSSCPWCNGNCKEKKNDEAYIAVCENNPEHIVEWLPWPG